MMKTIAVVAVHKEFAEFIKWDLENYFSDYAEIQAYSTEEIDYMEQITEEFVVMSALTVFRKVQPKMRSDAMIQVISFAMSLENLAHLKEIPKDCKVLMANVDYKMCMQVIAQIYEAGYGEFDFQPYYGDEETRDKSIKIAVTPNELEMVPQGMDRIINLGERPIDINVIVELANKMGIEDIFASEGAKTAKKRMVADSFGIERVLSDKKTKNEQMRTLIEFIQDGIVLTDSTGFIFISNKKARAILKSKSHILEGFNINDIVPELSIKFSKHREQDKVIEIEGKNIVASISPIFNDDIYSGNVLTFKSFEEAEEKQHGIRAQIAGGNHKARYFFEDIVGQSLPLGESIQIAKRMAKSDSSVLIIGESGTGKEVFAQSIHNSSERRKYNFVALNCAAIPEHLLESELFGYEEGAFTGAKKGGKIGYFELAHKGTIFLDEIGEMPMNLQSKLLRVLEEKSVVRIGSASLIDIDVRIIAATNKDLLKLVGEKQFREDLYYRINVLPLSIPPLRERKGDIPELLWYFAQRSGDKLEYTDEAIQEMTGYKWRGNIRELRNAGEYLASIGKNPIEKDDVLSYFNGGTVALGLSVKKVKNVVEEHGNREFIYGKWSNIELYANVMAALKESREQGNKIGRKQIEERLRKKGFDYTEAEIRTCLTKLADMGFIKSKAGRGGSVITPSGEDLLYEIIGLIG